MTTALNPAPETHVVEFATLYERTKRALAGLEQALSAAKAQLLASAGVDETSTEAVTVETADGVTLTLVPAIRRNFDVDALAKIVTADTFEGVTKTTVAHGEFDKAVKRGDIVLTKEQRETVIDESPYTRIV